MPTDLETWRHALRKQGLLADSIEAYPTDTGVTLRHTSLDLGFHHSLIAGPLAQRALQSEQAILKACNNKTRTIRKILDLTAGWGGDGLTLARHGHPVTWLEQHPLIHAVLGYSLAALKADAESVAFAGLLNLESGESLPFLQALPAEHDFDCIFLDPMFPPHKSGAKPGKELQILQAITENRDMEACFELARHCAGKRVVVKRPLNAPTLTNEKPDICYREKSIRFDVYLVS